MTGSEEPTLRFDGLFEAKVEALREVQDVAEQRLEVLLQAPVFDSEALHRLHEWTHSHADEADALLVAMVQLEVCEALIGEAEAIFDALRHMEARIKTLLGATRG